MTATHAVFFLHKLFPLFYLLLFTTDMLMKFVKNVNTKRTEFENELFAS